MKQQITIPISIDSNYNVTLNVSVSGSLVLQQGDDIIALPKDDITAFIKAVQEITSD